MFRSRRMNIAFACLDVIYIHKNDGKECLLTCNASFLASHCKTCDRDIVVGMA
jgi:hypothetical protein